MATAERIINKKLFKVPKTWASASKEHLLASAKAVVKQPFRSDHTADIAKDIVAELEPPKRAPEK